MDLTLDTNIYRNLVRGLGADQLLELQNKIANECKKKDIRIFFPINSAMELISHFNDENPEERNECHNALILLVNLSTTYSTTHLNVNFTPPLNVILATYFFGEEKKYADMYSKVIMLSQMLVGNITSKNQEIMDQSVMQVKNQLEFEKEEIRTNYEAYLKSINNGEADWSFFSDKKQLRRNFFKSLKIGKLSFLVAQSFVDRAYSIAQIKIEKNEAYFESVKNFISCFAPALIMNELLMENIGNGVVAIQDVADKRWNTVIDISLIFGALFNPTDIDRKLVTEEKNILKSYADCGMENKIINLEQFKYLMEID